MDDTEVFNMWLTLHESNLRVLREQYERDTGQDILFLDFALLMYYEGYNELNDN